MSWMRRSSTTESGLLISGCACNVVFPDGPEAMTVGPGLPESSLRQRPVSPAESLRPGCPCVSVCEVTVRQGLSIDIRRKQLPVPTLRTGWTSIVIFLQLDPVRTVGYGP